MTLKTEILSSFEDLDPRVVKFIDKTITAIEEQKIEVTDYTKMILNLLITQLVLYYKASDDILKIDTVTSEDSYKRKSKMPEISIMQKANDQILILLDKITLSPLSSAKVKKLNEREIISKEESSLNKLNKLKGK